MSNCSLKLPNGEMRATFLLLLLQLVWAFASDTFGWRHPPVALSTSDAPVMLITPPKQHVHHSASYMHTAIWAIFTFCSTEATEITSDLPLPEATSSLMSKLDVRRPPAKWELRHNHASSIKLLLWKIQATPQIVCLMLQRYIDVNVSPVCEMHYLRALGKSGGSSIWGNATAIWR